MKIQRAHLEMVLAELDRACGGPNHFIEIEDDGGRLTVSAIDSKSNLHQGFVFDEESKTLPKFRTEYIVRGGKK